MKGLIISFQSDEDNTDRDQEFAQAVRRSIEAISGQYGVKFVSDARIVAAQAPPKKSNTPMSNTRVATGEIPPSTSEEF